MNQISNEERTMKKVELKEILSALLEHLVPIPVWHEFEIARQRAG
jgi:hypothetical protein